MFCLKFCHRYVCVVARSGYAVQPRPPLLQSACCGCRVLPYVLSGLLTNVHSPLRLWTWTPF